MNPDISYVIAAYNAAETVGDAVRAALDQTGLEVEVIVVDDASQDATADVVRSIGDSRVRLLHASRNSGAASSRNRGLELARGDWVAILDADDTLLPDRSHRMVERADSLGTKAVVDNVEIVDRSGPTGRYMFEPRLFDQNPVLHLDDFIRGNVMLDRSIPYALGYLKPIVRRDVAAHPSIAYPDGVRIGEDFYFLAGVLAHGGGAATVRQAGYRYLLREGSESSSLQLSDVRSMRAQDDTFRRSQELGSDARCALGRRSASLDAMMDYLNLRDALRIKDISEAARILRRRPSVVRHLRIPVEAKLGSLLGLSRDRRL